MATPSVGWIVHIAGPVTGPIQRCAACGGTLQDNSDWFEGRVAVWPPEPDACLAWWPEGKLIGVHGNCTVTLGDRPLTADERMCAGVN